MLAAFTTLAFAATLWLAVVLLARMIEESGARILAAAQPELIPGRRGASTRRHEAPRQLSWRVPAGSLPALRAAA